MENIESYGISMSKDGFFYLVEAEMYVARDRAKSEFCDRYVAEHWGEEIGVTGRHKLRSKACEEFEITFGGKN